MSAERGKHIISAAKSLKGMRLADQNIAAFLDAISIAGRAGLFASALRHAGEISLERAQMLAVNEGFSRRELQQTLLPWLESGNLAYTKRLTDGTIQSIESLVLTYEPLLVAVDDLFVSLDPTREAVGCIEALALVTELPRPQSEVAHSLSGIIGEEHAKLAIELAKGYNIVVFVEGGGLPEPILYSEHVWTRFNVKAAKSLSPLSTNDRAMIIEFVNRVKSHQGMPENLLRAEAHKHNAEHMLQLALSVGLINRTQIQMSDGSKRWFLTTPHFYADMGAEFGEDMCDRVKIFLDSIRNGQYFGSAGTGKIVSPEKLLSKLLNVGEIGPCTAIGTDYVTSEQAGIVKVRRSDFRPGQSFLELVQRDTVEKVHDIITTGSLMGSRPMTENDISEGVRFGSIEQLRGERAKVPAPVAEAEREIIQKLRES